MLAIEKATWRLKKVCGDWKKIVVIKKSTVVTKTLVNENDLLVTKILAIENVSDQIFGNEKISNDKKRWQLKN